MGLCSLLLAALPLAANAEPPGGKKLRPRPAPAAKKPRERPRRKRVHNANDTRRARHATEPKREAPSADQAVEARGTAREPNTDKPEPKRVEHAPAVSNAQKAAQDAAQGVNAEIVKEGDTSVKVMTFSGLDIEGRLKSPQLLYFVSRVHTEFDRPKLPHRSFMPELDRSTEQEPVR
jgi:hypothetical protein